MQKQARLSIAEESRGRPRGRPQRLPVDPLPSSSPTIDVTSRMAWLLATSRLMSREPGVAVRDDFVRSLQSEGHTLDASRISRWESGTQRPSPAVLEAYEGKVGLPRQSVAAAERMLRRLSDQPPTTQSSSHEADELDSLFALVESAEATGGDWLRLANGVAHHERVYLHPDTWTRLCAQLVSEMTRSSGIALLRRYEAAAVFVAHPQAQAHLTRQVGEFVMHPDVQNVAPAMALLRGVGDGAAADLVLRLLRGDDRLLRHGASAVAGGLAADGRFGRSELHVLELYVARELSKGALVKRLDVLDLVGQLPEESYARVLAGIKNSRTRRHVVLARTSHEVAPPDISRIVAEGMATFAESALQRHAHDPDQMLRRLIREALFHAQRDRRHASGVLLGLSPYGRAIARSLLDLTGDPDDLVAGLAWSAVRRMGHLVTREEVAVAARRERRPGLLARAHLTIGLCHGPLDDQTADSLARCARDDEAKDSQRHAALFALGMGAHDHLHSLAADNGTRAGRAAAWWIRTGPSLHDPDVVA